MRFPRSVLVLSVTAVMSVAAPVAVMAWGGGGCGAGTAFTEGAGTTVDIVDACFTPAILRVEPGTRVTFVNRDAMVHNVTANDWGHWDDLHGGDRFSTSFDDPGVYPFACTYHPGMTGAIVVGEATGSGELAASPVEPGAPVTTGTDSAGRIAAGAAGLMIGFGAAFILMRSRRALVTPANA